MGEELMEEKRIYQKAVYTFGDKAQMGVAMEECAELIQALSKFLRYGDASLSNLKEEMADVEIMLGQLKEICGDCDQWKEMKLKRLEVLVDKMEETDAK